MKSKLKMEYTLIMLLKALIFMPLPSLYKLAGFKASVRTNAFNQIG